jgi:hypothetical protein
MVADSVTPFALSLSKGGAERIPRVEPGFACPEQRRRDKLSPNGDVNMSENRSGREHDKEAT